MTSKDQNQTGGVIMMGLDYSALVVKRVGDEFQLLRLTCIAADKGKAQKEEIIGTLKPSYKDKIDYQPAIHLDIFLRMVVSDSKCRFYYSLNGKLFKEAGEVFVMKEGKWIGAKIGLLAVEPAGQTNRGWIEADWFRVTAD